MQEESYDSLKEKIRDDFIRFFLEHYGDKWGMRQKFAKDLDVLPQTISDIFNKNQYVSLEVILKFQASNLPPFNWQIYNISPKKATQ